MKNKKSKMNKNILMLVFVVVLVVSFSGGVFGLTISASASSTSINVGDTVQFNIDVSDGIAPYTYCWDFGTPPEGAKLGEWNHDDKLICYSTTQNPFHTFNRYGRYKVWIYIKDTIGTIEKSMLVIDVSVGGTIINPTIDCGANNLVGDGLTDNSNKLAACINNLAGTDYTFQFPAGIYRFTAHNDVIGSSKNIEFKPANSNPTSVTFLFDPIDILDGSTSWIFLEISDNKFYIHDIIFERDLDDGDNTLGDSDGALALKGDVNNELTIERCTFTGFRDHVKESAGTTVQKCNFLNYGAYYASSSDIIGCGDKYGLLSFTSGGTYTPSGVGGFFIKGATSGATARLCNIRVDSGSWVSGDATGIFWITTESGTFQNENIDKCTDASCTSIEQSSFVAISGAVSNYERYLSSIHTAKSNGMFKNSYWNNYNNGNGHLWYGQLIDESYVYFVGNFIQTFMQTGGGVFQGTPSTGFYFYRNMVDEDNYYYHTSFLFGSDSILQNNFEIKDCQFDGWGGTGADFRADSGTDWVVSDNYFFNVAQNTQMFHLKINPNGFFTFENNIYGEGTPQGGVYDIYRFESENNGTCGDCTNIISDDPNIDCGIGTCISALGNINDNMPSSVSDPGPYEFTPPTTNSFQINNNNAETSSTTVTLNIGVTDSGSGMGSLARFPFTQGGLMMFSNDNINWYQVEDYATTHTWNLISGDGTKTVYSKFRDRDGNWGDVVSDSILLSSASSSCGPADTDFDGVVSILEVMAYITDWKAGNVDIVDLMAGITEWKNGCV